MSRIEPARKNDHPRLVEIWEASVRATHHFLTEADIQYFKSLVGGGVLSAVEHLLVARDSAGRILGFIGVDRGKIEMLFVDPACLGSGIGRRLLRHAAAHLGATTVDVNEQNERAVGFYERMGFRIEGRSERDGSGKPFPLLHMRLVENPDKSPDA